LTNAAATEAQLAPQIVSKSPNQENTFFLPSFITTQILSSLSVMIHHTAPLAYGSQAEPSASSFSFSVTG